MAIERGRPRDADIDAALESALLKLLAETSLSAVTVSKLIQAAGTSKPAFYRRYESLGHFLTGLLVKWLSTDGTADTGSLRSDIEFIQRDQVVMFTSAIPSESIGVILASVRESPVTARTFYEKFLRPRRDAVIRVLERAVTRDEIPPVTDPEWIVDLISAPFLMRAILPGVGAIDESLVQLTTDTLLRELKAKTPPGSGSAVPREAPRAAPQADPPSGPHGAEDGVVLFPSADEASGA